MSAKWQCDVCGQIYEKPYYRNAVFLGTDDAFCFMAWYEQGLTNREMVKAESIKLHHENYSLSSLAPT